MSRLQDLLPTILSLIDGGAVDVDGLDISSAFSGGTIDRSVHMNNLTYGEVILYQNFKYVYVDSVAALYDLGVDPSEANNVLPGNIPQYNELMRHRLPRQYYLPFLAR